MNNDVKIDWDFADTKATILRLIDKQQAVARQFIANFQRDTESPAKLSA